MLANFQSRIFLFPSVIQKLKRKNTQNYKDNFACCVRVERKASRIKGLKMADRVREKGHEKDVWAKGAK